VRVRRSALLALLIVGCSDSHDGERPFVDSCGVAIEQGRLGDDCALSGECGQRDRTGDRRDAALCDSGALIAADIRERTSSGSGPCPGEWHDESDAFVSFATVGEGCVEVTFCNEVVGGGTALRIAEVCQVGPAMAADPESPQGDCVRAAAEGTDGDACAGDFACIADREIAPGDFLPVIAWCDAGILRLAPSQTVIHGVP